MLLTEPGKWGSRLSVVIYNAQVEIRQALIDYASAAGTIDPAAFFVPNWRLTREGEPVF